MIVIQSSAPSTSPPEAGSFSPSGIAASEGEKYGSVSLASFKMPVDPPFRSVTSKDAVLACVSCVMRCSTAGSSARNTFSLRYGYFCWKPSVRALITSPAMAVYHDTVPSFLAPASSICCRSWPWYLAISAGLDGEAAAADPADPAVLGGAEAAVPPQALRRAIRTPAAPCITRFMSTDDTPPATQKGLARSDPFILPCIKRVWPG